MSTRRLVVGISGSSGAILGIRLLQALQNSDIETHLVISQAARLTIEQETDFSVAQVQSLATVSYHPRDLGAAIASGSFATQGMVVIPCSIKSLSAIANSYSDDLLARAADVTLKEGRPLVLVVREAPLHAGHVRLLDLAAQAGAVLFPPVPAFYSRPETLDQMIDNIVGRVLNRVGIETGLYLHWQGLSPKTDPAKIDRKPDPAATRGEEFFSLPAMTLATQGADGQPHAATVYFAADGERRNLYFFSAADSQHSLDLVVNPRAAATIDPPVDDWREIRGLQMRGSVQPLAAGPEWEMAWQVYLSRFPFVKDLRDVVARNTLYVFRPDWVRQIDNRRGFGFQEEWTPQ